MRCRAAIHILSLLPLLASCAMGKEQLEINGESGEPEELVDFVPSVKVKEIWSRDFGQIDEKKLIKLEPYLEDGVIYVADSSGKITAYSEKGGKKIWRARLKQPVTGAVGLGEQSVLLGTSKGKVIALDKKTGKQQWERAVSSEILVPPVEAAGIVIVQSIDGKILGLSARDGSTKWVQTQTEPSLSLRGTATPIVFQGVVLTGMANGSVVAVNLSDGRLIWNLPVATPQGRNEIERLVDIDAPPVIHNGLLFAGSYQGKVVAISLRTGRAAWSRGISTYTGLVADSANIYLTDDDSNVIALDQKSGSVIWRYEKLRGRKLNAPVVTQDYVVVGDLDGYVHWLKKDDGSMAARYRVANSAIRAKALVNGDVLYVSNLDGKLKALRWH